MKTLKDFLTKLNVLLTTEPVAVGSAVAAVVALLAGFGVVVSVTPAQIGSVLATLAVITGFIVRSKVTPVTPNPDPPAAP